MNERLFHFVLPALVLAACSADTTSNNGVQWQFGEDAEHDEGTVPTDAGAATQDADSAVVDMGPTPGDLSEAPDVSPPATCELRLVDEISMDYGVEPSCGVVGFPLVVAARGGFEAIGFETRFCRDRPGWVFTQRVDVGQNRLTLGELRTPMSVLGVPGSATTLGNELVVASGGQFVVVDNQGDPTLGNLPQSLLCATASAVPHTMAGRADQIFVGRDVYGCGGPAFDRTIIDRTGAALLGPTTSGQVLDATVDGDAVVWVEAAELGVLTVYRFDGTETEPVFDVEAEGWSGVSISPWPFTDGAFALAYGTVEAFDAPPTTHVLVVDAQGVPILSTSFEPIAEPALFGWGRTHVAPVDGALIVASQLEWQGGADRGFWHVTAVGAGGEVQDGFSGEDRAAPLDLATRGPHAAVHRGAGTSTALTLFDCR